MAKSQIRAVLDDGPRGGETIMLDAEPDKPPHEIMLPDGHLGARAVGDDVPHPTGSVSRYRLVGPDDGNGFRYRVVPHGQ
jgi:hypothetical protein